MGLLAPWARGSGRGGRVVRHERAGDVRARPFDDARGRRPPGRWPGAAASRGPQRVRFADGGGRSGRAFVAAAGRAAVRDLTRRLRRAAAARAAVDGRQLVLVGAPVDEHAAAAEPRAVRDRVVRRGRRRVLRRLQRRAARALDGVRRVPAVLPQPQRHGHRAAGAVGLRGALGERLPGDAGAADAAAAVPVHGVRGVPSDGRARVAAAAVLVSGRPGHLHGRRRVPLRFQPSDRSDQPPRHRAPPRLPARGLMGALVDEHPHRRTCTCAGARAFGPAGRVCAL